MAQRIDVTGTDGVRLTAWEFADPPTGGADGTPLPPSYCCTA